MQIRVIGSGSDGNTYVIKAGDDAFILDCGCKLLEVKKYLNFNIGVIRGCYISHGHIDHARYKAEYERTGIPIIAPYLQTDKTIERYNVTNFVMTTFILPHNGTINYGLMLTHTPTNERLLYLTDMEYCKYSFKSMGIDHILVECNYQKEFVNLESANKEHKISGHCELDTCLGFVKANKTVDLKNVMLIHMGFGSTDENQCIDKMKEIVGIGVNVFAARPNTTYDLIDSRIPFTGEIEEDV